MVYQSAIVHANGVYTYATYVSMAVFGQALFTPKQFVRRALRYQVTEVFPDSPRETAGSRTHYIANTFQYSSQILHLMFNEVP